MNSNPKSPNISEHGLARKAAMLDELQDRVSERPAERRRQQRNSRLRRVALSTTTVFILGLLTVSAIHLQARKNQEANVPNQPGLEHLGGVNSATLDPRVQLAEKDGTTFAPALRFAEIKSNRNSVVAKYVVRNRPAAAQKISFDLIADESLSQQLKETKPELFLARIDSRLVVFNRKLFENDNSAPVN